MFYFVCVNVFFCILFFFGFEENEDQAPWCFFRRVILLVFLVVFSCFLIVFLIVIFNVFVVCFFASLKKMRGIFFASSFLVNILFWF